MKITLDDLVTIMPRTRGLRGMSHLPLINAALAEFEITTPGRVAAFLAQLAHESGELRYFEELSDGKQYENRKDLGNTEKGDGPRFKGRGPIQLTGRANYRKAGAALGVDLEAEPSRAADPNVGFRIAGWFWKSKGLNLLADQGKFDVITRTINGGYNHKAERDAYHATAKKVLGVR